MEDWKASTQIGLRYIPPPEHNPSPLIIKQPRLLSSNAIPPTKDRTGTLPEKVIDYMFKTTYQKEFPPKTLRPEYEQKMQKKAPAVNNIRYLDIPDISISDLIAKKRMSSETMESYQDPCLSDNIVNAWNENVKDFVENDKRLQELKKKPIEKHNLEFITTNQIEFKEKIPEKEEVLSHRDELPRGRIKGGKLKVQTLPKDEPKVESKEESKDEPKDEQKVEQKKEIKFDSKKPVRYTGMISTMKVSFKDLTSKFERSHKKMKSHFQKIEEEMQRIKSGDAMDEIVPNHFMSTQTRTHIITNCIKNDTF